MSRIHIQSSRGTINLLPVMGRRGATGPGADITGAEIEAARDAAVAAIGSRTTNTVAAAGASQTLPDVTVATSHVLTLTAATCALTFPSAVAGRNFTLTLKQDATGSRAVTWPAGVKWPMDVVPALQTTASAVDEFTFFAADGTWRGSHDAAYSA